MEAHTRRNGTKVKRHWRAGGNVKGHYCAAPTQRGGGARARSEEERRDERQRATTVWAEKRPENATLARALERTGKWRVSNRSATKRGTVHLAGVRWAATDGSHGTWPANPPPRDDQELAHITVLADLREAGELEATRLEIRSDAMVSEDGSVHMTAEARGQADAISRAVERFGTETRDLAERARKRNRLRQRLESDNPERALIRAVEEMLALTSPPELDLKNPVTVPAPGGRYVVTVAPMRP